MIIAPAVVAIIFAVVVVALYVVHFAVYVVNAESCLFKVIVFVADIVTSCTHPSAIHLMAVSHAFDRSAHSAVLL